MGIFTVGGGVPPELVAAVLALCGIAGTARLQEFALKRYNYGCGFCPEPVHWGGLSGSTYTEAVSVGKIFCAAGEGGKVCGNILRTLRWRCHL